MLQVYSALITCDSDIETPVENFLYLNILDTILLTKDNVEPDTVFLCTYLAVLHRSRSQRTTAINI
jgi:hypothetical protein